MFFLNRFIFAVLITIGGFAEAGDFAVGDQGYLCIQYTVNANWPEHFAIKVEIVEVLDNRYRVKVIDDFPMKGRTNEEEVPVLGNVLKVTQRRVYTSESAGVKAGDRFEGKPVCSMLMKQ